MASILNIDNGLVVLAAECPRCGQDYLWSPVQVGRDFAKCADCQKRGE